MLLIEKLGLSGSGLTAQDLKVLVSGINKSEDSEFKDNTK